MSSAETGFLRAESRVRDKVHPCRAIIVCAVTLRQTQSILDRWLPTRKLSISFSEARTW